MLNLKKLGSRLWDQANVFDSGRTFQQRTPTNNRSVIGQATHNAVTNTVGNLVGKPIANAAQTVSEVPRFTVAAITSNRPAMEASRHREWQNLSNPNSIPNFFGSNISNAGQAGYNLAFKAPVEDLMGHTAAAENARTMGLRQFNQTAPGALVRPVEAGIASLGHASKEAQANVGLNPDATGAQKYIGDPVMGALGTFGLVKGAQFAGKRTVGLKDTVNNAAAGSKLAKVPEIKQIPVVDKSAPVSRTVTSRVPVRTLVTGQEAADRYNGHMANLSKEYGLNQKQVTLAGKSGKQGIISEPSVINDVGYQAKKQQIEQAYADGTISKPIKVTQAPGKPKVSLKQQTAGITRSPTDVLPSETAANAQALNPYSEGGTGRPLTADTKLLDIKINRATDPVRKAELIAERDAQKAAQVPPGQVPLNLPPAASEMTAAKTPGKLERAFTSTSGIISKFGDAGQELARRLKEHRYQSEIGQEKFLESIPTVGKLSKGDFETFVNTLDARSRGENPTAPPNIMRAVLEWNQAIPTVLERARAAGKDVGDLGPNYFPRIYKDLFTNNSKMVKMAEGMVRDGKATDFTDAVSKLKFMQREYIRSNGNLDLARTADLPGYEKTHDALTTYIDRSFNNITQAEQFGPKGEIIEQAKSHMLRQGHDVSEGSVFDHSLKIALGDTNKNTGGYKASAAVRKFNALRSLNTAAISNATQLTNAATVGGIARTAKAVSQVLNPFSKNAAVARASARQAGVELDHSIKNLAASQLGVTGKITKNVASPFFHIVEKFNRTASAIVGKDYGNHLAAKAAKGDANALETLRTKFGITDKIGPKLTRDQEMRVASKMVELSQFKVDPMDLPGWVDSPLGRLAAQFRTFGYKQTGFMYNEVLREATKGNFTPLARFIAVGVPAGSASLAMKGAIRNQPMTGSNPASQVAQALSSVGGGGLPATEGQNLASGIKYNDPVGAVLSTVGGPTLSVIGESGKNITTGMKSGNWHPLIKEGVRSIPVAGPATAGHFLKGAPKPQPVTEQNKATASLADIKAQDKTDIANFEKTNKGGGYGLTKTASGKYIYQVGNEVKTTTDLKKARQAIALDSFDKSGEQERTVGDKYYYRDANDTAKSTWKFEHDFNLADSQNQLDMTVSKDNGDYAGWNQAAASQLKALETRRDHWNKVGQKDKIADTEKQIEVLKHTMAKYAGYGGSFTKGGTKSAVNKAYGTLGSSYKYAVSRRVGSTSRIAKPKVSVAKSSSSFGGRVATGGKPKVSLKRSKV